MQHHHMLLFVKQGFVSLMNNQRCGQQALLLQAKLCSEVIEALEQNGNGRLQLERLLLRFRELRNG